jgi:hypothetical protein
MFDGRFPLSWLLVPLAIALSFGALLFGVGYLFGSRHALSKLRKTPPPIVIFDGTNYTAITNIVRVP